MRKLAIVAVVRDRGPRLVEWLAFHRAVGVRDVVIYDEGSRDGTAAILKAHERLGVVTVPWPEARGGAHQLTPQDHFLASRARLFAFAVFLDVDEFLVPPPGRGIAAWLDTVPAHAGAVLFAPRPFGGGAAASGLVLRGLPCPDARPEERRPARALYRRGAVALFRDAVLPEIVQGEPLNGDFSPAEGEQGAPTGGGAIQLNRYGGEGPAEGGAPCARMQAWIGPALDEMRHFLTYANGLSPAEAARFAAPAAAVPELAGPVERRAHLRWRLHNLHRRTAETAGRRLRRLVFRQAQRPW